MTNDPVDQALADAGAGPSPAFEAHLEDLLARAYDGEQLVTTGATAGVPPPRDPRRRAMLIGAAAAVVVLGTVGAIALATSDDDRQTIVNAPSTETPTTESTLAPETTTGETTATTETPGTETAATETPSTEPEPAVTATSTPPSTSTIEPATTAAPLATPTIINLGVAAPPPPATTIASYGAAPAGDLYPTALATVTPDGRIVVFDAVNGDVRFLDGTTGAELSHFASTIPGIGAPEFMGGPFLAGPDDVLYFTVHPTVEGTMGTPTFAAFAHVNGAYVEVTRHEYGPIEMTYHLGPKGIGENFEGIAGEPLMPFVGVDGQPSGATLDLDPLVVECTRDNSYVYSRSGRSWDVSYVFPADVHMTDSTPCTRTGFMPDATRGPNGTVVLVQVAPQASGDVLNRVTILGDDITSYDTDWEYVGSTDDALIFSKTDQDSVDIARLPI